MVQALPSGLLLAYYGDDFTGSTAVMEVMTFAGLPTILFLTPPTPAQLTRRGDYRGIGIAGVARSKSPAWMDAHLPAIFDALARLQAPISHYKVCSTFDSTPHVGSIGRAIDLAVPRLGGAWHPLVLGAPAIERYQLFGNLFAVADGVGHRLDRHPTMSRHPVTPMAEADVRRHLAGQTRRSIGLVDHLALTAGQGDVALAAARAAGAEIIAIDVLDQATLAAAGRLVWNQRGRRLFAVGLQGLEYALVAHWQAEGLIEPPIQVHRGRPVERLVVASGSCAPVTAAQIEWAIAHGFAGHRLDAALAVDEGAFAAEIERVARAMLADLGEGRDPLVYTAIGPDDPAVTAVHEAIRASGEDGGEVNDRIGTGLGRVLERVLRQGRLGRAVIAGGDSSGHGASVLGIHALTAVAVAAAAPGAPICRAHGDDPAFAELEITLKRGQMGGPDFFGVVKAGGRAA